MPQTSREGPTDQYVDTTIRVRYAETDLMGVVYHANYPIFFEMGRSEFMREKGFTYRDFEASGYRLVVTALEAKYHNSATYDDVITVRTRVSELQSRGLTFQYAIYKENTLLVEGKTKHLCINSNKKPVMIPPELLKILKKCLN